MLKKFINKPEDVVNEMVEGYLAAHGDMVRKLETSRVLVRKDAPIKGKVGLVTGGGSGHKPAFIGYIGENLLDGVAVGEIFSSPSAQQIYDAIKACDGGKGVLCVLGNYSGDVMNFDMAVEMAREDGIEVEQVIINDDVGSAPKDKRENRRGVAGEVVVWKAIGAKAAQGASLEEVKRIAVEVNENTRSMGVAHSPCAVPSRMYGGEPTFTLGEMEMEIGVGHHGEPGVKRMPMKTADEVTELLTRPIIEDLPFKRGDRVSVLINGLGSTSLLEMYIVYRKLFEILKKEGIEVALCWIGEFFTSLEMGGFSITLTRLNKELESLLKAPARAPLFKWC
ncbi:dihydroxyacetone kinase subunit DhaK [Candidatus Aerophobetes bacterium]|nr:dihydroxyacetone kinase subunit DhaK [Candidatus Aerophobetes bacterium]